MSLFSALPQLGAALLALTLFPVAAQAQLTILLPDQPTQEVRGKENKKQMDVLLALGEPFDMSGLDMDMPQMFAVLRRVPMTAEEKQAEEQATGKSSGLKALREDLLGELEEIRYMDKRAWAAHVDLEIPGLYQLMAETRPHWASEDDRFEQQFVKVVLPVRGIDDGWDLPVGLNFEILPLTRPFGLTAPALFTGKAVMGNEPMPGAYVSIIRLNTEKRGVPSPWHAEQVVKTDAGGVFSFVCSQPGWWSFRTQAQGTPMKGADGQLKPLEMGAVLWIYVDDAKLTTHKPRVSRTVQP